jgi:PRTRC genetic system protein B
MKNITPLFDDIYIARKAIIIYECQKKEDSDIYVEAYDMDSNSCPINAHPLDVQECARLARALDSSQEFNRNFLKPKGLLPENVVYINPAHDGCVIWETKAQQVNLCFSDSLAITSGKAKIPALLWKATKENLYIYALCGSRKLTERTTLFNAPFFNIHEDGLVCMGTVDVNIEQCSHLEDFISQWQRLFL